MSDVIARARAVLEGVSDAPWEAMDYDDTPGDEGVCLLSGVGIHHHAFAYTGLGYPWITPGQAVADAEFIAAARSLVPELVAELETTRAQRDQAQDEVKREHGLFAQEAAATNRRVSEAWQAGFVEGQRQ